MFTSHPLCFRIPMLTTTCHVESTEEEKRSLHLDQHRDKKNCPLTDNYIIDKKHDLPF